MGPPTTTSAAGGGAWALARSQHGVVTRHQLRDLGFSSQAVRHRLRRGRLHAIHRGVYALGRPELSREGRWMAAVLACGPGAVLSHMSAAALWEIRRGDADVEVSVPRGRSPRRPGIVVHTTARLDSEATTHLGIPVTSPARTLVDLAARLPARQLEAAANAADKLGLARHDRLLNDLERWSGHRGVAALRRLLDPNGFVLTESDLERRFVRLVRGAGLPAPEAQVEVAGWRVDFLWRELGLVVETDGLTYHRTAAQQARDRRRDQALVGEGLTVLRFTNAQVRREPREVELSLRRVAARLRRRPS